MAQHSSWRDQLWLEFGAWSGRSTRRIIRGRSPLPKAATPLYSFDSFRGLPEDWRSPTFASADSSRSYARAFYSRGSFDRRGRPPFRDSRVEWVVGWFNETLPAFLRAHTRNVSFVHVDCDLYSSASLVLRQLEQRLSPGAVLVFDELINYPEYARHEMRALLELQRRSGREVEILGTSAGRVHTSPLFMKQSLHAQKLETLGAQDAALRLL